tara:strand:+ start:348 stop:821 length:474 start_codon:yes stop_codon:yes gene_type:complete
MSWQHIIKKSDIDAWDSAGVPKDKECEKKKRIIINTASVIWRWMTEQATENLIANMPRMTTKQKESEVDMHKFLLHKNHELLKELENKIKNAQCKDLQQVFLEIIKEEEEKGPPLNLPPKILEEFARRNEMLGFNDANESLIETWKELYTEWFSPIE